MTVLPCGDPACWGMDGLPLLPPDWLPGLAELPIELAVGTGRQISKTIPASAACDVAFWKTRGTTWPEAPATLATRAAELFVSNSDNQRWLDHAILSGPPRDLSATLGVPYLRHTKEVLVSAQLWDRDLGWRLADTSALEMWQTIGDMAALLDLIITSRNWVRDRAVTTPCAPNVENIFDLASERFLAMAGVPIRSASPNLESSAFRNAIGGRVGLRSEGSLTLEEAGALINVTRERLRQLAKRFDLNHGHQRIWPDHGVIIELLQTSSATSLNLDGVARLAVEFQTDDEVQKEISRRLTQAGRPSPHAEDLRAVRAACWELSDGTGFFRVPDIEEMLGKAAGLSGTRLIELIGEAAEMIDLPHGYGVVQYGSRDSWIVTTSHRILSELGPMSATKLRFGLERRHAGRRSGRSGAAPPSVDVLLAFFERRPDFEVSGTGVSSTLESCEPIDSIQGWILRQIEHAGGVAHHTTLMELARRDRKNRSSVNVYLSVFGYLIEPIGNGCYTPLGRPYSPTDIFVARSVARTLSVPTTDKKWTITPAQLSFRCSAGSTLLNTGVLGAPARVCRLIGDRRLLVCSSSGTHGHIAVSGGNLYGFSTVFQALDATPGDTIKVTMDLTSLCAHVTLERD